MFFRNLTMFRFPTALAQLFEAQDVHGRASFEKRESHFDQAAAACALKPVGPLEFCSRGFVPPFGRDATALTHRVDGGDAIWLTVGTEDKLLPAAVVNDRLQKKLAELEQREGRRPGGRTRKRLKEDLVAEMLPQAFVRPGRVDAMLDLQRGLLVVDTTSRKQAEMVVSEIRHALGSFPALSLNAEVAARAVLTGWVAGEPLPEGLSLGDECELRDAADRGACWKGSRAELLGDEVREHLSAGKQVTRLALSLDDHVSCVFGEDLVARKFRLLDGAVDALESLERDDLHAELDARFALMAGEVGRLFDVLAPAFNFSDAEG